MWQSVGLTLLVIVATLLCVLLFMLCGPPFESLYAEDLQYALENNFLTGYYFSTACRIPSICSGDIQSKSIYIMLQRWGSPVTGWYVVWQLFLSKFKFLRELIGDSVALQGDHEPSESEAEHEAPSTPPRPRPKSARQRRAPAEEAT